MSTKQSEFKLVTKIMALLNIGEEGKLHAFFSKIKRRCKDDIANLEHKIAELKLQFAREMQQIEDDIEDAEVALEDAYLEVNVEQIDTNQRQKDFVNVYLSNIKGKENTLDALKKSKKNLLESYEKELDTLHKMIETIKTKMNKIIKG